MVLKNYAISFPPDMVDINIEGKLLQNGLGTVTLSMCQCLDKFKVATSCRPQNLHCSEKLAPNVSL